jgi:methyl-accepting chemotaxis protein
VADEIRLLASKSKAATNQIANIVKEMLVHIDESAKISGAVYTEIDSTSTDLTDAILLVSRVVSEQQNAIAGMEASAADIMLMVESITAVSEENSASSEEVSASAEEMNTQVEEVGSSARALEQMALALQKMVAESGKR